MIEIREAASDEDFEAWRQVRLTVLPNERAGTVEEMRKAMTPESIYLLAELDGGLAGSGTAGRSDLGFSGFVAPRVLPWARRRGVGTALLHALADHLLAHGFDLAGSGVEDDGALAFAERFGFREIDRQVEQVWEVQETTAAGGPDGVGIVSVAERPELWAAAYNPVALQAFEDMALEAPLQVSLEQWERDWMNWPEATFLAVADGEVVGSAGLLRDEDQPERSENALTVVRRDWRGRGVAAALKRTSMAFAATNGLREVYTWTQRGNADMRRLNQHLGYVTRTESISIRAPLPLPV